MSNCEKALLAGQRSRTDIASWQKEYLSAEETKRDMFVSHSINCEDVILNRLFSELRDGVYIDVGAGHPRFDNDTFALYERGWCGINIEPNHSFYALLVQERPRDTNLRMALSNSPGEITYYEVGGTGLSTCDAEQAGVYRELGHSVITREVPVKTLSSILSETGVDRINVLKVDVEGFEEKVLDGNDWGRFRPEVVVVEATYPNTPIRRPTNIRGSMEARGYRHVYFDGLNDFYLEREVAAPEGLSLPPNIFDRFMSRHTVDLKKAADEFARKNERMRSEIADLRKTADELGCENAHLEGENGRLKKSAEQMRKEILELNRLLEPLHVMSERNEELLRAISRRDEDLRGLHARLQSMYMSRSWLLTKPWRFVGRLIKRMLVRGAKHVRPWLAG
jgi:FkbM family methyltransferase